MNSIMTPPPPPPPEKSRNKIKTTNKPANKTKQKTNEKKMDKLSIEERQENNKLNKIPIHLLFLLKKRGGGGFNVLQ